MLLDAFDSNWIAPLGPHVEAFEKELAGRVAMPHAAALSSGTAADLALQLLGVGRGDDVMVSSLTFAASANPVTYVGARPVFVDSERSTWNLDPDLVEEEFASRRRAGSAQPKAVVVVDLYGQCANYTRLVPLCEQYGVPLVEDAAEGRGATWAGKPAGSFGTLAVSLVQRKQDHHHIGVGACSSARTKPSSRRRASSRRRRETRRRTTNTATSETTTG